MKANELMRGNWVFIDHSSGRLEPCYGRVTGIDKNGEDVYTTEGMVDISLIKPVPLTKEILERNGFIYREWAYDYDRFDQWNLDNIDENGEYHGTLVTINRRKDGEWMDTRCRANRMYDINYVHQLQNFLRQCEVDKEITIKD